MGRLSGPQNQLYKFIDALLWEEWDPIGVNDSAPRDEYQSYTPQLFSLAIKGAAVHEIADRFIYLEEKILGLESNERACKDLAEKIMLETKK
ncbi:hypothetical protein M0L20_28720 [Spirosoma sp. RP8]|uniref:DUF1871 family protein n=1 Tax=Spirosoma liriopis TaxID=2937440 RepID=A0ABT0HUL2_9BACT|nr:hypothetical protein [Spirosoma liriopis]MCK8495884.1 hypothetical protein [Spirosoma liriopis]